MSGVPIAIQRTGLVTSVGLTAPQSCAAFRAKLTNPSETRFIDSGGEWIMAHQVPLEQPWRGLTKLAKMAAMAIEEVLDGVAKDQWPELPLLLCVAEAERPGRLQGLDDQLFHQIQAELGVDFAATSAVVAHGRVGVAVALAQARKLLATPNPKRVQRSRPLPTASPPAPKSSRRLCHRISTVASDCSRSCSSPTSPRTTARSPMPILTVCRRSSRRSSPKAGRLRRPITPPPAPNANPCTTR